MCVCNKFRKNCKMFKSVRKKVHINYIQETEVRYTSSISYLIFKDMNPNSLARLTPIQKTVLGGVGGLISVANPWRADLVSSSGEVIFPRPALRRLANKMYLHPVGRQILKEKPLINDEILDSYVGGLSSLESNSFGYHLHQQKVKSKISFDTRTEVKFEIEPENSSEIKLEYVIQRYRQVHDMLHLLLDQPTNYVGEATVKAFEAIQTQGLPMTLLGASAAPVIRFIGKKQPKSLEKYLVDRLPWAVHTAKKCPNVYCIYWEKHLAKDINELRRELNISVNK